MPYKKVFLVILDGFGLAAPSPGNAVLQADMTYLNSLISTYPSFSLMAASVVVGLPSGKFGNSEVGHSTIGTGRIVTQDWARINNAIKDQTFFNNEAFLQAVQHCKDNDSAMHIAGCFSEGGIHSHEDHLFALVQLMQQQGLSKVYLHLITDGKDTPGTASLESLTRLEPYVQASSAQIATVSGRKYGMDRVQNWDLTKQVWDAMVHAGGETIEDVRPYLEASHAQKLLDDEVTPGHVVKDGAPVATVQSNDSVIFFDYRNDRINQLVRPFVTPDFSEFDRGTTPENLFVVSMTPYASDLAVNAVAYPALSVEHTLGDVMVEKGLRQVRIAEQEKKAHVTSFFDGGRLEPLENSEHVIVESKKLPQNELAKHPAMAADKIVEAITTRMAEDISFYVINFANSDMVAHTGNLESTIQALGVLDNSLKSIIEQVQANPNYAAVITCDHGNSEEVIDPLTGGPDMQHSANHIPTIIVGQGLELSTPGQMNLEILSSINPSGSLIDVAPTVLQLFGFDKPVEMTGQSLI